MSATKTGKLSFVFIGETALLVRCVEYVLQSGHDVLGVVSPDANARKALESKCFIFETVDQLQELDRPSALFSIVNYQILNMGLISWPKIGSFNFHDGPLPSYAGINATPWAIINGETSHGISWHLMTEEIDAGPICQQLEFNLSDDDTAYTANSRAQHLGFEAFKHLFQDLEGDGLKFAAPANYKSSYYHRFERIQEIVSWNWKAHQVSSLRRGTAFEGAADNWLGEPKIIVGDEVVHFQFAELMNSPDEVLNNPQTGEIVHIGSDSLGIKMSDKCVSFVGLSDHLGNQIHPADFCLRHSLSIGSVLPNDNNLLSWHNDLMSSTSRTEDSYSILVAGMTTSDIPFPGGFTRNDDSFNFIDLEFFQFESDSILFAFSEFVNLVSRDESETLTIGWVPHCSNLESFSRIKMLLVDPIIPINLDRKQFLADNSQILNNFRSTRIFAEESGFMPKGAHKRYRRSEKQHLEYPVVAWFGKSSETAASEIMPFLQKTYGTLLGISLDNEEQIARIYCAVDKENKADSSAILRAAAEFIKGSETRGNGLNIAPGLISGEKLTEIKSRIKNGKKQHVPSVISRFVDSVNLDPNKLAFASSESEEGRTYGYLFTQAKRISQSLSKRVNNHDLVAILLPRGDSLLEAVWGCLLGGFAFLPLDPGLPEERLKRQILLSKANVVIVGKKYESIDLDLESEQLFIEELIEFGDPSSFIWHNVNPKHTAYVLLTSGTTGDPKAVAVDHKALNNRIDWMIRELNLNGSDRFIQKTPVTFDVAIWELILPLSIGAFLRVPAHNSHRDPKKILEEIEKFEISVIHFVPPMLDALITECASGKSQTRNPDFANALRWVICSGEELKPASVINFQTIFQNNVNLANLYGPAEAAIDVTLNVIRSNDEDPGPIYLGTEVQNTFIEVISPSGHILPNGLAGEIVIGGSQLAKGYIGNKSLTKVKFPKQTELEERIYKTGDLAVRHSSGQIEYLGRIDHEIKINGIRVDPKEIDEVIRSSDDVTDAITLLSKGPVGKMLVSFVIPKLRLGVDHELHAESIIDNCKKKLPAQMIPSQIKFVEVYPTTSNGKVDRTYLLSTLVNDSKSHLGDLSPEQIRNLKKIAGVLNSKPEDLDLDSPLRKLGVNSIDLLRISSELKSGGRAAKQMDFLGPESTFRGILSHMDVSSKSHSGNLDKLGKEVYDGQNFLEELEWLRTGVEQSSVLVIHSALWSFPIEQEELRNLIIQWAKDELKKGSTLFFPMFNFDFNKGAEFDISNTVSQTGILPHWILDSFPEAFKTPHPYYTFACLGPKVDDILEFMNLDAFGAGSQFDWFEKENAGYLLLGTHAITQIHHYEQIASVPYRVFKEFSGRVDFGNGIHPIISNMFVRSVQDAYLVDEKLKMSSFGDSLSSVVSGFHFSFAMSTQKLGRSLLKALEKNPYALLDIESLPSERLKDLPEKYLRVYPPPAISRLGSTSSGLDENFFQVATFSYSGENINQFQNAVYSALVSASIGRLRLGHPIDLNNEPRIFFQPKFMDKAIRALPKNSFYQTLDRSLLTIEWLDAGSKVKISSHHMLIDIVSWLIFLDSIASELRVSEGGDNQSGRSLTEHDFEHHLAERHLISRSREVFQDFSHWSLVLEGLRKSRAAFEKKINRIDVSPNGHRDHESFTIRTNNRNKLEISTILKKVIGEVSDLFEIDLCSVMLENNGRGPNKLGNPSSGTIGWLTSFYPVVVNSENTAKDIDLAISRVPNRGYTFQFSPAFEQMLEEDVLPIVQFNYLGKITGSSNEKVTLSSFDLFRSKNRKNSPPIEITIEEWTSGFQIWIDIHSDLNKHLDKEKIVDLFSKVFGLEAKDLKFSIR